MRTIILTFALLFTMVVGAQAQIEQVMKNVLYQNDGQQFVLKDFAGGPSGAGDAGGTTRWSPIDTTSWMPLTDFRPGDTTLIAWAACNATSAYNLALQVQFAQDDAIKPVYTLDSLVRIGPLLAAAAAGETTKDSILTGRSIYFLWKTKYAGANKVRILLAKDTAQATVTDLGTNSSTTARLRAGFHKQPRED